MGEIKTIKKNQMELIKFYEDLERKVKSSQSSINWINNKVSELNENMEHYKGFNNVSAEIVFDSMRGGDISIKDNDLIAVLNLLASREEDRLKILKEQLDEFKIEE